MRTRLHLILAVFLFMVPTVLLAHGNSTHVMGTVTESTQDHIVVKTTKGKLVTITVNAETILNHNGINTKTVKPQVGNRVIAETVRNGDTLVAKELRFSSPKSK